MHNKTADGQPRLLVIDDNPAIHEDFRKVFGTGLSSTGALAESEAALFGDVIADSSGSGPTFQIDSAFQGQEGLALIRKAREQGAPYAVAFIDVRMPPGWDGIETTARI